MFIPPIAWEINDLPAWITCFLKYWTVSFCHMGLSECWVHHGTPKSSGSWFNWFFLLKDGGYVPFFSHTHSFGKYWGSRHHWSVFCFLTDDYSGHHKWAVNRRSPCGNRLVWTLCSCDVGLVVSSLFQGFCRITSNTFIRWGIWGISKHDKSSKFWVPIFFNQSHIKKKEVVLMTNCSWPALDPFWRTEKSFIQLNPSVAN